MLFSGMSNLTSRRLAGRANPRLTSLYGSTFSLAQARAASKGATGVPGATTSATTGAVGQTTMGGGVLGRMHNLFGEQYAGMGGAFFAGVKTGLFSMFRSDPYGSLMSGVTKAGLKAQNVKGAKLNMAMKQFRQGMYDIRSGGAGMLPDVKNRGMLEIAGTVGLGIGELGQYAGLRAMTGMNLFHFAGMKAGHFAGTKGYSPVEPRGGGIRGAMSYGSRSSIQGMKGFGAGTVGGLGVAGLGAMLF